MYLRAVHLNKNLGDKDFNQCLQVLSSYDQGRILKYIKKEDRDRALVGALLARKMAAIEQNVSIEHVEIGYADYGKPFFIVPSKLCFNISHSGQWVVCILDDYPVGIDIERIQPIDFIIAEHFFSFTEWKQLLLVESQYQLSRFYDIWTLKESYVKAIGTGFNIPFNSFSIHISSAGITVHSNSNLSGIISQDWHFTQYSLHEDYKLSVCASNANFPATIHISSVEEFLMRLIK